MATALDRFADAKPRWDEPVMIESHQNGVRTKAMNPNTPITDDELFEDAIRWALLHNSVCLGFTS